MDFKAAIHIYTYIFTDNFLSMMRYDLMLRFTLPSKLKNGNILKVQIIQQKKKMILSLLLIGN